MLGAERPGVLHAPEVERDEGPAVDLERHLGELLLRELVAGDRLAEDDPLLRVVERALEAGARPSRRRRRRSRTAPRSGTRAGRGACRDLGRRFSSGTRTSWRTSSEVTDARSESFLWISGAEKPGMPCSTMKPRIAPSSVRAQTIAMSAIVPFVIHIFAPFRIQSEPSRRACVRIDAGVGAGVGLGQPEAADDLARVHRRQPALLLLLGARTPDREHRERALHGDGAAHAGVAGLELHARQPVGDGARAWKAVARRGAFRAARASRAREELAREDALLEPVADLVEDVVAHELADGVADRPLLVVEEGVDREVVEGIEGRDARSSSPCARHPTRTPRALDRRREAARRLRLTD